MLRTCNKLHQMFSIFLSVIKNITFWNPVIVVTSLNFSGTYMLWTKFTYTLLIPYFSAVLSDLKINYLNVHKYIFLKFDLHYMYDSLQVVSNNQIQGDSKTFDCLFHFESIYFLITLYVRKNIYLMVLV